MLKFDGFGCPDLHPGMPRPLVFSGQQSGFAHGSRFYTLSTVTYQLITCAPQERCLGTIAAYELLEAA